MAGQKQPLCPKCKSRNVNWRGIEDVPKTDRPDEPIEVTAHVVPGVAGGGLDDPDWTVPDLVDTRS